jgi:hypothetical protein
MVNLIATISVGYKMGAEARVWRIARTNSAKEGI